MTAPHSQRLGQSLVLVEDDPDDVEIIRLALEKLGVNRPLHVFPDGDAAYEFLNESRDNFGAILCDFHLVRDSGVDLRARIAKNERLHKQAIPFILLTDGVESDQVEKAYELPIQGVFVKETSVERSARQLEIMLAYWSLAMTPNAPQPSYNWANEDARR